MERLVAMMAFCEAPLDGTLAPSSVAAGHYGSSATGGSKVMASLAAAMKERPVERLVASMAFCEAPLDGTFAGTSAPPLSPSSAAGGGGSASATNVPDAKKPSQRLQRDKSGTVLDGLAIFETVALQ